MPLNVTGTFTARDGLTIGWAVDDVWKTIKDFISLPIEAARTKYELGPDVRDWKVELAQKDILDSGIEKSKIIRVYYRPFDIRFTYYTGRSRGFHCMPRGENMKHMLAGKNLAMGIGRQGLAVSQDEWDLLTCFTDIPDLNGFRRGGVQAFPLYLYTTPEETAGTLFAQTETTRKPNLAPEFIKAVEEKLKVTVTSDVTVTSGAITPEDIFYYTYAVLHSPTYRTRYAEFLKIDFPRLPITSDKKLFRKLAGKGKELVELHLLKSSKVDDFVTTYPEAGDNKVEKVAFVKGKVFINSAQFFGKVPEEVWEFKVGGYQVCEKWLKDRKGRVLSGEDITHYQRIVVALKETIRLMKEIDKDIPKFPIE